MSLTTMLFVPTILFMTIVAPIWITMHYRSKNRMARGISEEERDNLEYMLATLDKLADRVETLESILAEDHRERGAQQASPGAGKTRASGANTRGERFDG